MQRYPDIVKPFQRRLTEILEQMDQAYEKTAGSYGFVCNGCGDNCCETRFYHFTLLEYLLLRQGLATLAADVYDDVCHRARKVDRLHQSADARGGGIRVMCPLNASGRCLLYGFRPMICRLHGVPHQLRLPDGRVQVGPGCADFESQCPRLWARLDRTPLYRAMADLEKQVREAACFYDKIKMTVAQMVLCDQLPGLCRQP